MAVYANRRRIRGARGLRLQRQRGERVERSFAHLYETGRMRRTHLRGHSNILKRLLIHSGAFNLGLLLRSWLGVGTPRGLQGRMRAILAVLDHLVSALTAFCERRFGSKHDSRVRTTTLPPRPVPAAKMAFTTGC
jgi:transposase